MSEEENLLNYSEALETTEKWRDLTELQRKIIYTHITNPELNKSEIARTVGCQPHTVWMLFHTKWFYNLNVELARIEKRELLQLALKSLKESLSSKTPLVKLSAAIKVLTDADVLKLDKQDNKDQDKINVVWGGNASNEDVKDKLSTSSKTESSTFITSKI